MSVIASTQLSAVSMGGSEGSEGRRGQGDPGNHGSLLFVDTLKKREQLFHDY